MQAALVHRLRLAREGRGHLLALALIVLLAVALRIAWVAYVNVDPTDGRLDDSLLYHGYARSLAEGRGYVNFSGEPSADWPPGYSALLSLAYFVFGPKILAAKAINIALAAVAVLLTYAIGTKLFDRRVGQLAALFVALLPSHLYFSTLIMSENLFVPAVLLVVLLLASWGLGGVRPTALQSSIVGAAIGISALTRAEGVWLLLPAVVLWFAASGRWSARLRNCALVIGAAALVLTPWTVRNAIELHRFIPIRETSANTFAIGLNPNYRYYGVVLLLNPLDPRAIPKDQSPTLRQDLEIFKDHPGQPFDLARRKTVDLFDNDHDVLDLVNNNPSHPSLFASAYKLWRSIANGAYYALGATAVIGLGVALFARDRRAWLIGGIMATWILGFLPLAPEGRYHLALLPLAAVFAAALMLTIGRPRVSFAGWQSAATTRAVAVAAAAIACAVAAAGAVSNAEIHYEIQPPMLITSPLDKTVTLGDLEVTARGFSMAQSDPAAGPAPPGDVWVVVDLMLRNTGSEAIVLLGPAQATVADGLGNSYPLVTSETGPLDSDIGAGQTIETPAVFAVPTGASGLVFIFRAIGVASEGLWILQ